jgi:hypothetical protein
MFGKRKRLSPLDESAVALATRARKWTDRCGAQYLVEATLEDDVVRLGRFDTLACSHALSLRHVALPDGLVIASLYCDLRGGDVVVCLGKTRTAPKRTASPPAVDKLAALRMRTTWRFEEADAEHALATLTALLAAFEAPEDARLQSVVVNPSCYDAVVSIAPTCRRVPGKVLRLAARLGGVLDFGERRLELTLLKKGSAQS